MNKLFLLPFIVFCFLFSCQTEEVTLNKAQAPGSKSEYLAPGTETPEITEANIPDPTYLEPEDPGSMGGAGGDPGFLIPASPAIDNGFPLVNSGNKVGIFTASGGSDGEMIIFHASEPNLPRPLIVVPSARGLGVYVSFLHAGKRYMVRFYYSVTTYNGQIHIWSAPQPIKIVAGTLTDATDTHWVPASWNPSGTLISPGYYTCNQCSPAGELNGTMAISQLTVNDQGRITLQAVVNMPGKSISISRVNWNRWH